MRISRRARVCAAAAWVVTVGLSAMAQTGPLDDPARPAAELERDAGSRPLEVYAWLGIEPGMTVADLMPFAGYNSHILAHVVGADGRVLAPWAFTDEAVVKLRERFVAAGLANVEPMRGVEDIPDDSIDVWLTVRNVHDLLIPSIGEQFGFDGANVLAEMFRTLKPGGVLGVVDARTAGVDLDDRNHRVHETHAIAVLEAVGFELVDSSDLLRVEGDDYGAMGYPTRWDVDRFLLQLTKPTR
jgi:predicted methyltransferase